MTHAMSRMSPRDGLQVHQEVDHFIVPLLGREVQGRGA